MYLYEVKTIHMPSKAVLTQTFTSVDEIQLIVTC